MIKCFSQLQFNYSKSRDLLPLKCKQCNKIFYKPKNQIQAALISKKNNIVYCSHSCQSDNKRKEIIIQCKQCNKRVVKKANQVKLYKNNFCSSSCSAKYNNSKYPKRIAIQKENTNCLQCENELQLDAKKYCTINCQVEYEYHYYINKWKLNIESGTRPITKEVVAQVRRYIKEKYNNKCQICGQNEKNPLNNICYLEIHHIDGKSDNNSEDNLMLLCPNCHSLTPTYRALNIGNKQRKKY